MSNGYKTNGRRAWRKLAKAYRRWLNRDERRYRDPYEDEPSIRYRMAWFEAKKQFGPDLGHSNAKPFTASSLVGMTKGARKRNGITQRLDLWDYLDKRLRPCPGCFDCSVECWVCHEPHEPTDELCGGSGVIRAGKLRPHLRRPDCGFYVD